MSDAGQVVTAFLRELGQPQPRVDELLAFFTDDGVWWDAPPEGTPVFKREATGTAELRAKFEGLAEILDEISAVEVFNQLAVGDTVLSERVDRVVIGGQPFDIEICAVFKVRGDKIALWRDYYSAPAAPEVNA